MKKLLKDYLENNDNYAYKNVDIVSYWENGSECIIIFNHNEFDNDKINIDVWDMLLFIYNKM